MLTIELGLIDIVPFRPRVWKQWPHTATYVSIRQHTSAYVSIRRHTSAYVGIRRHTSAYVSGSGSSGHTLVCARVWVCRRDIEQHLGCPPHHTLRQYPLPLRNALTPHIFFVLSLSLSLSLSASLSPTLSQALSLSLSPAPPRPPPSPPPPHTMHTSAYVSIRQHTSEPFTYHFLPHFVVRQGTVSSYTALYS